MRYRIIPVTDFQQNCTLLWCEKTLRAAVVDPGGDVPLILAHLEKLGLTLEKILITHPHIDHAGGVSELLQHVHAVTVEGPQRDDQFWIESLSEQSRVFRFPLAQPFAPDRWLEEGDTVQFGEVVLQVLHCPGHTPGHVVFYSPTDQLALVGDVLFQGSIGRTDFPRSSYPALIDSIRHKLWPLGDAVTFIPGHGPLSTFGAERRSNPFVGDAVRQLPM